MANPRPGEPELEIYVSYANQGESQAFALALQKSLAPHGIRVRLDRTDIGVTGSISEFMADIGRARYVLLLISDAYLRSKFCMSELLQVFKHGDFRQRAFAVTFSDAKIVKAIDRLAYASHWGGEISALNGALKEVDATNLTRIQGELNLYARIRTMLDRIVDELADKPWFTPEELRASGFAALIEFVGAPAHGEGLHGSTANESGARGAPEKGAFSDHWHLQHTLKALHAAPEFVAALRQAIASEIARTAPPLADEVGAWPPAQVLEWFVGHASERSSESAIDRFDAARKATKEFCAAQRDEPTVLATAEQAIAAVFALASMGLVHGAIDAAGLDLQSPDTLTTPVDARSASPIDELVCKIVDGALRGGRVEIVMEPGRTGVKPLDLLVIAPNEAVSAPDVESYAYQELFRNMANISTDGLDIGSGKGLDDEKRALLSEYLRVRQKDSGNRYTFLLGAHVPAAQFVAEHGLHLGVIVSNPEGDDGTAQIIRNVSAKVSVFIQTWCDALGTTPDATDPAQSEPAASASLPNVHDGLQPVGAQARETLESAAEVSKSLSSITAFGKMIGELFSK